MTNKKNIEFLSNISLEEVLVGLDKARGFIRSLLGKRLKIKRVPELIFEEEKLEKVL